MRKWAAVIGSPIAHSLSPVLHRAAFAELGLDWEYLKFEVTGAELPGFLAELDAGCVGLSVTAPLKRELLRLASTADATARVTGAANTLARSVGMEAAFNTDVQGIVEAVRPYLCSATGRRATLTVLDQPPPQPLSGLPAPVILGTGATACSALAAVRSLGAGSAYLVGRGFGGRDNALAMGTQMGMEVLPILWKASNRVQGTLDETPLLISTVPPAATERFAAALNPSSSATLLDVTYSEGVKPLEGRFRSVDAQVASPLEMLVHQGIAQVKIWTSRDASYAPLFEAVSAAASVRSNAGRLPGS